MFPTRRQCYRFSPLLLLALAATSAQAADNCMKLVPSTALAWGAVNHMKDASDKIQKLATLLQAPTSNVMDEMKREVGVNKGLDEKGAAGFFVVPGKTGKDAVATAIFAAITDEKEFLGNFEILNTDAKIREVKPKPEENKPKVPGNVPQLQRAPRDASTRYLAFRNGYALLAPKSDRVALEAALEAKQDISAEMAGCESWLTENDGTVVGTAAGIKWSAKQAEADLKNPNSSGGNSPALLVFGKAFQTFISNGLMAVPKEFSLALGGVRCDKEGSIRLIGRARLVNGGLVSKAVTAIPAAAENLLSGVPGGQFVFAVGSAGIPKLTDAYMDLALSLLKSMKPASGMSAEDLAVLSKESIEVARQVRSINFVMKTGKRGDPIYSNMYSLVRLEDSRKLLDFAEKANKLIQNGIAGAVKSATVKRLEIAGKPALQQEVTFDLSSMAGPGTDQAMFDEIIGIGGKVLVYYVAADEHAVLVGVGVSQERMLAALDVVKQPKKSLAEDTDVSVTASMLPADSQWVAYLSLRGCMQMGQRSMTMAMKRNPGGIGFTLPSFPKSPPIGLAVKALPAELHGEVAIPAAVVQAYGDYLKEVQKMFMNQMQQNQPPAPAP